MIKACETAWSISLSSELSRSSFGCHVSVVAMNSSLSFVSTNKDARIAVLTSLRSCCLSEVQTMLNQASATRSVVLRWCDGGSRHGCEESSSADWLSPHHICFSDFGLCRSAALHSMRQFAQSLYSRHKAKRQSHT